MKFHRVTNLLDTDRRDTSIRDVYVGVNKEELPSNNDLYGFLQESGINVPQGTPIIVSIIDAAPVAEDQEHRGPMGITTVTIHGKDEAKPLVTLMMCKNC